MAKEKIEDKKGKIAEESSNDFAGKEKQQKNCIMEKLFDLGAKAVDATDKGVIRLIAFLKIVWEKILDGAGSIFVGYDKITDLVSWRITRTIVLIGREIHDLREKAIDNSREIVKHAFIALIVIVGSVILYASAIDYEYSYNGRTLGVVREQKDVIAILGLISDQLSKEYGADIKIDPETDIEFKPVITYGKQKDSPDTVLKRFTYMGDIQAQATSVFVDGKHLMNVESEEVANNVLDNIKTMFTEKGVDYLDVSFAEKIELKPCSTTVSAITSEKGAIKRIKDGGEKEDKYIVESGDSFYGICNKLNISQDEIKKMNPGFDEDAVIHIGDELIIKKAVPLLTVKTVEMGTYSEAIPYKTEYKTSSAYYEGESFVSTSGENGKTKITAKITKENGTVVNKEPVKSEVIIEPVTEVIVKGTKKVPPKIGKGYFIRPVPGIVTSYFGSRWGTLHKGTDFNAYYGETVKAADGGNVIFAGYDGSYGYLVKIDHGQNRQTWYAHLSSISVSVGESVFQGQKIGGAGDTGYSFGVHLHWEVRINGVPVNGLNYL